MFTAVFMTGSKRGLSIGWNVACVKCGVRNVDCEMYSMAVLIAIVNCGYNVDGH